VTQRQARGSSATASGDADVVELPAPLLMEVGRGNRRLVELVQQLYLGRHAATQEIRRVHQTAGSRRSAGRSTAWPPSTSTRTMTPGRNEMGAGADAKFKEFDCPSCNANNPRTRPSATARSCSATTMRQEYRAKVSEEGRLKLKEI